MKKNVSHPYVDNVRLDIMRIQTLIYKGGVHCGRSNDVVIIDSVGRETCDCIFV